MNRRLFLIHLAGCGAAAALAPAGFSIPNKLFKMPERWEDIGERIGIALVDENDKLFAAQTVQCYWEDTTLTPENNCIWTPDQTLIPEHGLILKHAIVSLKNPMEQDGSRMEMRIDTGPPTMIPRNFGNLGLNFSVEGIVKIL